MKAVGTNTAERTRAMPTTGAGQFFHCFQGRGFWRHALFDVPFYAFPQRRWASSTTRADGQHQTKKEKAY